MSDHVDIDNTQVLRAADKESYLNLVAWLDNRGFSPGTMKMLKSRTDDARALTVTLVHELSIWNVGKS